MIFFSSRLAPALAVSLVSAACGHESGTRYIVPVTAGLPPYTPAEAAVFDDSFAPELLDLPPQRRPDDGDPKLIERTQSADTVVRARVSTVTRAENGQDLAYRVRVVPIEAPFVGSLSEASIELELEPDNPAVPVIRAREATFVGKTLVLFLRRYNDRGAPGLHFQAEPDFPQIIRHIERAVTDSTP